MTSGMTASTLLAHPESTVLELGAPPLGVALAAVVLAAAVLNLGRFRARLLDDAVAAMPDDGPLPRGLLLPRAVALLGLITVVGTARLGPPSELDNLASPLVTGVLWPGVLLASVVLGAWIWRALDPIDSLARLADPRGNPAGPRSVWPAAVTGTAALVYLHGYARTDAATAGYVVAAYAIAMLAGAVAAGRSWVRAADVLALAAHWCGLRGRLSSWRPPAGAELVLGALVGGMLAGELAGSSLWTRVRLLGGGGAPVPYLRDEVRLLTTALVISSALVGAVLCALLGRWAERREAPGSVAAALVPLVAGLAVAGQLRRLFICVQLLIDIASDPFGRGWDLFGTARSGVNAQWLGPVGQRQLACAVVAAAGIAAALVLARRAPRARQQDPAAAAIYLVVTLGVLGAATTF